MMAPGHAARLNDVGHAEQSRDGGHHVGPGLVKLVHYGCRPLYPLLQRVGGFVHGALRHRHEPDKLGQVSDTALDPAGVGEAVFVLADDAIGDCRGGESFGEVAGAADVFGVAERYGGLDQPSGGHDLESQTGLRFGLGVGGGHVLRLEDHGRASGRGDKDVGLKSGVVNDDLGVLGAHDASGEHLRKKLAEGVVGAGFGLLRHWSGF